MFVNNIIIILGANPFIDAYLHSDFLGRSIFLALIFLSVCSWVILIHKGWMTFQARKKSLQFRRLFHSSKSNPLSVELKMGGNNPFQDLYQALKKFTIDILNKNQRYGQKEQSGASYLSNTDIDFVESHLITSIATQTKRLEKNLFILSTIVSLAPFLGLLGTVWGILTTFSELQTQVGNSHQMALGGLSLALATTVLGLIDAIPALIGYNYLKNSISNFQTEMEGFSNEILASVEMQYRKVDLL